MNQIRSISSRATDYPTHSPTLPVLLPWVVLLWWGAWGGVATGGEPRPPAARPVAGLWESLFDGQTHRGWRAYRGERFPERGWVITNGCLVRWPGGRAGDLVTEAEFDDFEFEWEWRIVPAGNNGVKYLVLESRPTAPGHEYQMVDDTSVRDPRHRTAAFYDVLPPHPAVQPYPPGQWNRSRIVVRGNTVEHWLNDVCVLRYTLGSAELHQAIRASKFRDTPGFGQKCRGRIMLTDHGTETWFRHLRVRRLDPAR